MYFIKVSLRPLNKIELVKENVEIFMLGAIREEMQLRDLKLIIQLAMSENYFALHFKN